MKPFPFFPDIDSSLANEAAQSFTDTLDSDIQMNTLQKKYCITTENRVVITDEVHRSYRKMSLKLTGYSEVPRSQAYWIYASVDCSSRHVLNTREGVYATNTLGSGPSNSHFTAAQVCQSGGQCWPNTERHPGMYRPPPVLQSLSCVTIPVQILQKAWKAFLVLNMSCGIHSVDLMAGYRNIMTRTSAIKLVL